MNWQYNTLPYLLQFGACLLGLFVAAYDYERRRRPAPLIVGAIFMIAFLLPFFSDLILRGLPMSLAWLADTLIPNNRYGLLFYIATSLLPWLYFWPRFYLWLTTAPAKTKRRK